MCSNIKEGLVNNHSSKVLFINISVILIYKFQLVLRVYNLNVTAIGINSAVNIYD